jgi:hypothetical protein
LNVLSGNPADHLVHRHTHRVVRGTLFVCGRPDGRLSALSTAEQAVCLSVNQASSIQSHGGTCESITIGHNPFKLALSATGIFLKRKRPLFLCERMLVEADVKEEQRDGLFSVSETGQSSASEAFGSWKNKLWTFFFSGLQAVDPLNMSQSSFLDSSVRPRLKIDRSAAALIGAYKSNEVEPTTEEERLDEEDLMVGNIVEEAIREKKFSDDARNLFRAFDQKGHGVLDEEQFIEGARKHKTDLSEDALITLFRLHDQDGTDRIDYHEFLELMKDSGLGSDVKLPPSNRDERGMIQIEESKEKYFGENIRKYNAGKSNQELALKAARSQHLVQELYETRVASLQRFVAMTVMFHQMGKRVEGFFDRISFGFLSYRMDRTHSVMRIATTASPVSGADVKEQMRHLRLLKKVQHSVHVISLAYLRYKKAGVKRSVSAEKEE